VKVSRWRYGERGVGRGEWGVGLADNLSM